MSFGYSHLTYCRQGLEKKYYCSIITACGFIYTKQPYSNINEHGITQVNNSKWLIGNVKTTWSRGISDDQSSTHAIFAHEIGSIEPTCTVPSVSRAALIEPGRWKK